MLVVTSVVGAGPVTALRGHTVASITATTAAADPLDPLTADEIVRTFTTIKSAKNLAPATFLPIVKLSEPSKTFLQSWSPGQPFPRKSFANVFDRNANKLYEGHRRSQDEHTRIVDRESGQAARRLLHGTRRRRQARS